MRLVRYADDFVVMVGGTRDARRSAAGRGRSGARTDGPAPVGGQDAGSATSTRGSTSSASASSGAAGEAEPANERVYTYPSKKALASVMDKVRTLTRRAVASNARRPAAPAQPGAAGLVHLLPPRRVQADLQLRRPLRLLADRRLAPQTTPRARTGAPWSAATSPAGRSATAGSSCSGHERSHRDPLPLPGHHDPDTMGERQRSPRSVNTWRAGCGGDRTSGSEGGPGKPTERKAGSAPRSDPYTYVATWPGVVYVAFIIDAFSRGSWAGGRAHDAHRPRARRARDGALDP